MDYYKKAKLTPAEYLREWYKIPEDQIDFFLYFYQPNLTPRFFGMFRILGITSWKTLAQVPWDEFRRARNFGPTCQIFLLNACDAQGIKLIGQPPKSDTPSGWHSIHPPTSHYKPPKVNPSKPEWIPGKPKKCKGCGQKMTRRRWSDNRPESHVVFKRRQYCSRYCYHRHVRELSIKKLLPKPCDLCGEIFTCEGMAPSTFKRRRFCSKSCAAKAAASITPRNRKDRHACSTDSISIQNAESAGHRPA